MGVVTAEPGNLLLQSHARVLHQLAVAAIPQFVTMSERTLDAAARRLEDVFALADRMSVKLVRVDVDTRKIDFVPA